MDSSYLPKPPEPAFDERISANRPDPATVSRTNKTKTCTYWKHGDRCAYSAAECRFAHYDIDTPVPSSPSLESLRTSSNPLGLPWRRVRDRDGPSLIQFSPATTPNSSYSTSAAIVRGPGEEDELEPHNCVRVDADLEAATNEKTPEGNVKAITEQKTHLKGQQSMSTYGDNSTLLAKLIKAGGQLPGAKASSPNHVSSLKPPAPTQSPLHEPKPAMSELTLSDTVAQRKPKVLQLARVTPLPEEDHCSLPSSPLNARNKPFSEQTLCWAVQSSEAFPKIKEYLGKFDIKDVKRGISTPVQGVPPIFFAVERNCALCVRLFIEYSADPNACGTENVPLLAFAVFNARKRLLNSTEVVKTLLSVGAVPHTIPRDMWENFIEPPNAQQPDDSLCGIEAAWCTTPYRAALAETLNLSQRYFLAKARHHQQPTVKELQVAQHHKMTSLFAMPYHLIGQTYATREVLGEVLTHVLGGETEPLVLVFAGPSGHGKTELAYRMGELLSVQRQHVDCTEMRHETDIFGPKAPYEDSEIGSPLNNHLVDESGKRNIVVLDEFDKTTDEVRKALLLVFDKGTYQNRRNRTAIDCTKTIWILATNAVDPLIARFFHEHLEGRSLRDQSNAPFSDLDRKVRRAFGSLFGHPLTGRLTAIIPFFPFNTEEAAVVTHKFISELADRVRKPIDEENLRTGHIHLHLVDDGHLCKHVAESGYELDTGARSIATAVHNRISKALHRQYLKTNGEIREEVNDGPLRQFTVQVHPGEDGDKVIRVFADGEIDIDHEGKGEKG